MSTLIFENPMNFDGVVRRPSCKLSRSDIHDLGVVGGHRNYGAIYEQKVGIPLNENMLTYRLSRQRSLTTEISDKQKVT